MLNTPVLLGSVRRGRQSIKVARFAARRLTERGNQAQILDLADYDFPVMEERLHVLDDPPPGMKDFSETLRSADAVVVITPEYNGGIPGALKNTLDYFYGEWEKKPVGVVSVSAGGFGGVQAQSQIQLLLLKVKALPVAAMAVSNVGRSFEDDGTPTEPHYEKGFARFGDTLEWYAQAKAAARNQP